MSRRGRGRRYESEPKLNIKKVFAVAIAAIVIIMIIMMIKNLLTKEKTTSKITSQTYFTSYKDNKWGVIDAQGKNIIDPSYKEMIIIPNSKLGVFLCTYDVNYETGEYKTKVLNEKNEEIFTNYENIEAIQNKDENNNLWYEQNVLKVQKEGKYGLINLAGKELTEITYEEITAVEEIENSYKIKKDGKFGIVDSEGKIVIEPQYTNIDVLGKDNKSGFIVSNDTGKYGVVDYSRNQVLEIKYDSVQKIHKHDLYVVTVEGKQKVVKKDGTDVLTTGFDEVKQILSSQENGIIFTNANKYGVMNLSGEIVIPAEYDDLKEAKSGMYIAKKGDKYGIINQQKEEKMAFEYSSLYYNEKADLYVAEDAEFNAKVLNSNLETKIEGILTELNTEKGYLRLRIGEDYKYYNFKFEEKQEQEIFPNRTLFLSKKDGKYGYKNKEGEIVVDYIYDDATEQNDYGFSGIKKDGKWGSINSTGTVVQEPTYELEDYILIDFVGRWHLGLDINMNYYNQQ